MLSNARAVATLEAAKVNTDASLLLHKRKDGGINGFIVIPFTDAIVKWDEER